MNTSVRMVGLPCIDLFVVCLPCISVYRLGISWFFYIAVGKQRDAESSCCVPPISSLPFTLTSLVPLCGPPLPRPLRAAAQTDPVTRLESHRLVDHI